MKICHTKNGINKHPRPEGQGVKSNNYQNDEFCDIIETKWYLGRVVILDCWRARNNNF